MSRLIADPLNMSLEAIISQRESQGSNGRRNAPVSLSIRNNTQRREQRQPNPYDNRSSNGVRRSPRPSSNSMEYGLKFLLNNSLAGTIIGNGGSAIRDLMDITEASIHISNNGENYPGTKERVVYITGSAQSLNLAQSLIWEMIVFKVLTFSNTFNSCSEFPIPYKPIPNRTISICFSE